MKAIITVGLGFGDEGKGATVDFLTREMGAELVVRYCGGAQAGHNVELPDGRRHTFSQFGAGTLAGARTYLGPAMIISPTAMAPEADHLRSLGVDDPWDQITAHPDCLAATRYHVFMNRLRESARGDGRHGSCGLGIGEARHYWLRYGQDAVFAKDLDDPRSLLPKLELLRARFLLEMQELGQLNGELAGQMHDWTPLSELDSLRSASSELAVASRLPKVETIVFEGSQGVLLDEWHGFHPFTTWSTVTPRHALELLEPFDDVAMSIIGVTRAYATRHGAGPFPTACQKMTEAMTDSGNPHNDWQGSLRFGPLDLVLLQYAARVAHVDGIFVNHLDEFAGHPRICRNYDDFDRIETPTRLLEQESLTRRLETATPIVSEAGEEQLMETLGEIAPIVGVGRGATHIDRVCIGDILSPLELGQTL